MSITQRNINIFVSFNKWIKITDKLLFVILIHFDPNYICLFHDFIIPFFLLFDLNIPFYFISIIFHCHNNNTFILTQLLFLYLKLYLSLYY